MHAVMSSCLCKSREGMLLPFEIEPVKDREDTPVDTLHIHKADHRPRPAPDFDTASFHHIRGAQPFPLTPRTREEGHQLRQISLQTAHELRLHRLPPPSDLPGRGQAWVRLGHDEGELLPVESPPEGARKEVMYRIWEDQNIFALGVDDGTRKNTGGFYPAAKSHHRGSRY